MKFSAVAVIVSFLVCTAVAAPVPFAGIKRDVNYGGDCMYLKRGETEFEFVKRC
ncbi:hypothetical protein PILCRDRAFT_11739 [Piloderma croceum F 1598]|uniref:Uncharacterized protein n=1 Tax=Piloderma croceum (strain F 1598) TaxID=765440 RepID=A0A0C3FDA7_PILCF|nr:hypothetical protein PILCRDRAFT_11739 [Piloderma croceum F 1598]